MHFSVDGFSFDSVLKSVSKVTDKIVKSATNASGSFCHVTNPKLPYVGALPNKSCSGTCIVVRGMTKINGDFSINLQCGSAGTDDIAFHFNVRSSQKSVVRNSRLSRDWGNEERQGGYPFKANDMFELDFIISRTHIKVKLDQSSFCDFIHRIDLEKITTLAITGEVAIHYVGFHHRPTFDGSNSDHDIEVSDSNFMKSEPSIAGELSCQQQPKGGYPQPVGSQQQPKGGYPQPVGSQQQQKGGYPQSVGSQQQSPGGFPQPTGSQPFPEGAYPQSAGSPPHPAGGYPQAIYPAGAYSQPIGNPQQPAGGYPQALGNQPYPAGVYPQPAGNPQQPAGAYPQPIGNPQQPAGAYPQPIDNPQQPAGAYPQPIGNPQQSAGGFPPAAGSQRYPAGGYPQPVGGHDQQRTGPSPQSGNQQLPNPLNMPIPGDMTAGRIVTISGTPRTGCKRFTINLECVKTAIKDIAFHIDVRMQRLGHSHQVIRNSCIRGRWGDEEKHVPYFPFQANASFDITILSEHDMFKVAVNNQHFTEFYHRMLKLDRINVINISGDVQLTKISFQ